jgi:hypothetical protein
MTGEAFVKNWSRPARLRSTANDFAIGTPLAIAAGAIAYRLIGLPAALITLAATLALTAATAVWRTRRYDQRWLIRQLDSTRPYMEDSADLLLTPETTLNPLQRLQRNRLQARLADDTATSLRAQWRTNAIAAAWLTSLVLTAGILFWPSADGTAPLRPAPVTTVPAGLPQLVAQRLRITPPAYTGLPARDAALTARAPTGSRLAWTLRFAPQPSAVALVTTENRRIPLTRTGDDWSATATLDRSLLYRVTAPGVPPGPLHRLDAIPDTPPAIRVIEPERTLTPMTIGQTRWTLNFDVTDDHGVVSAARLRLIVTAGEGENITFRETSRVIPGTGTAKRQRFDAILDVQALGLTPGNDIVAQLIVSDNRSPGPQVTRGPSLILRWPPDLGREAGGLDGMVKTVLPAYFRSQRQIIIDTEALIKQRRRLPGDTFLAKSDLIGVDQRSLRLRYGGLLGDETSEAPILPTSDAPAKPAVKPKEESDLPTGHAADDGHDHTPKPTIFGDGASVLADYGHAHGESDGATLLDPATSGLLRQAVNAMWESELNLRQGAPEKALPFAYTALRLIKEVQKATRIYLSRTGPELPPLDLTRRLTGDRKGLGTPSLAPVLRISDGRIAIPAAAWRALTGPAPVDLTPLRAWATANPPADSLALAAAIDAVIADPGCTRCRTALRGQLWAAMIPPPAQIARRYAGDATGKRYQDILQ